MGLELTGLLDFDLPTKEIERRKQVIRDVWNYKKVDHIPVMLSVSSNPWGYTMHDEFFSKEKQLQLRLASIQRTLELGPDDYIPSMWVNVGCVAIENALGLELYYGETTEQTPYVRGHVLDRIEDVYSLQHVDPYRDGQLPEFLERAQYFVEQTDHKIPVTCLDMNGPMPIAMDIVGSETFFTSMYTHPEEVRALLDFAMDNIIAVTEACIEVVGGIEHLTSTDFVWEWFPEGKKGHVSDDMCAMYKPEFFRKFGIPVNNRVFEKYGPGTLHNCGPNPCLEEYLEHDPPLSGVDLDFNCSRAELPQFRGPFKGRGIIYLWMEYESDEQLLADYDYIVDSLAPDVIAMPSIAIPEEAVVAGQCDFHRLHDTLRDKARDYARRIWG